MVIMLIRDRLRPGMLLFSVVMIFVATGILTTEEALAGFSNKGMITVALLFLVSEGIRRTDALSAIMRRIFPRRSVVQCARARSTLWVWSPRLQHF